MRCESKAENVEWEKPNREKKKKKKYISNYFFPPHLSSVSSLSIHGTLSKILLTLEEQAREGITQANINTKLIHT